MEIEYLILFIIFSIGVKLLAHRNKKKSEETRKRMLDRVNQAKRVEEFRNSKDFQHPISNSIINLLENFHHHKEVGKRLNEDEIKAFEERLKLNLPESYKIFLKYFGDGGSWVFSQCIYSVQEYYYLHETSESLGETIELDGEFIAVNSLLSLMTEDSNGGAWCWLTAENKKEWSLAYYSMQDQKLHYRVDNFTEWLNLLTKDGYEVIRGLDLEEKLGLG